MEPPELPALRPGAPGVDEQSPLELCGHQRPQPEQIDPATTRWRRGGGAPAAERLLVGVVDRHRLADPLVAIPPAHRQRRPARTPVPVVAGVVARAQPQRRVRTAQTHRHHTGPVPGQRALAVQPFVELGGLTDRLLVAEPAHLVRATQQQLRLRDRPVRADPARRVLHSHEPRQTRCGGKERGLADTTRPLPAPLNLVLPAQTRTTRERPLAVGDRADPPVERVIGRDVDHVRPEHRIERRPVEQRGQNLQPVLTLAVRLRRTRLQQIDTRDHRSSPHTVRSAASKVGSCTSTCP
jgi:hypothetical protein